MNIRKWVNFVLDIGEKPSDQPNRLVEVVSKHFLQSEALVSSTLEGPLGNLENSLLKIVFEGAQNMKSAQVDPFSSEGVVILSTKEELLVDSSFDLSANDPSTPSRILEKAFSRMRQYGIFKFGCLIDYETTAGDAKRGLEDIVSDIRAIPTVTIVSVVLANEKVATGRYVAGLQIKFIPSFPGSLSQPEDAKAYILRMIKKIKNVRGISRVTLKTDRIE